MIDANHLKAHRTASLLKKGLFPEVSAAKMMQLAELPIIRLNHMTPAQIRANVIADNRLAELAGWGRKLLLNSNISPNWTSTSTSQ